MHALFGSATVGLPEARGNPGPGPALDDAAGGAEPVPSCKRAVPAQGPRSAQPLPAAPRHPTEVVAGEGSAITSLYGRYASVVYRVGLAILGSREEAEDLTQDVFATLCGPTSYDPGRGSMRTFLTAMTRSRAIDRLRARGRSARLLKTWPEAVPFGNAPAMPWEGVSTRRTVERVRGALAGLPAAKREVLEMAYYRGLSQQEIAAELGTPLGTVKSWSRRALLDLGCVLEEFRG
jgi:RNA polymerase sigma-70 factor (ECF subfamily)